MSIILNTRNQPFFFDYNIKNEKVEKFVKESSNQPINIYFDTYNFKLPLYDAFTVKDLGVKDPKVKYLVIKNLNADAKF